MYNNIVQIMGNSFHPQTTNEKGSFNDVISNKGNILPVSDPRYSEHDQSSFIDSSYYLLMDSKSFLMESSDSISMTDEKSLTYVTEDIVKTKKESFADFLSQKIKKSGKYSTKRGFKKFNNDTEIKNEVTKYGEISSNCMITQLLRKKLLAKKKMYKLKWIPTTFINPIQECRFMDYMFPLNSEMFRSNNNVVMKYYFKLEKIKRITSIERDLKTGSYKLLMEHANPQAMNMYPSD